MVKNKQTNKQKNKKQKNKLLYSKQEVRVYREYY